MESSDLEILVANQRREFMAASAAESDLDLAFRFQMEEALAASVSLLPSTSTSVAVTPQDEGGPSASSSDADFAHALSMQSFELERCEQELRDADLRRSELRRVTQELRIRAHDEELAREINDMPEDDWEDFGDEFEVPMELLRVEEELPFRLYFKGMGRTEIVNGSRTHIAGIGVAICDPKGDLLLKIQKPVSAAGTNREVLDAKALIEGLSAVVEIGIKNVNVYFDFRALLNHVNGKWRAKQQKIVNLISQVHLLQRKIDRCQLLLLPRCHVKFVFKLARDVIDSQITKGVELLQSNVDRNMTETCNICLDITASSQMFSVVGCDHRFCFSCMKQHVEVKLLHGMLPVCPHLGCNIKLDLESCGKFLSPRLLDIMGQRIKEESIPPNQKVYCPFPRCSALMSLNEAILPQKSGSVKQNFSSNSGLRKCIKCDGYFCINCKVPWHEKLSCYDYKRLNPQPRGEEARLHSLARQKLWRQCVKCNHMIELVEGCFHMTCRCGCEFCYTCGAEWKDKRATCSCPLWDENYIWYDDEQDSEDDYDDEYDDYDDDDDDDYDDDHRDYH